MAVFSDSRRFSSACLARMSSNFSPGLEDEPPPEPPTPSPEIVALMQGQEALIQSQQQVAQALMALAEMSGKSRKKVPVRDKAGNLLHVIESIGD